MQRPEPRRWFRISRNLAGVERGVENDTERAERLAAPLWPESDQHDMSAVMLDIDRRRLPLNVFLAEQITRYERRPGVRVLRQHDDVGVRLWREDRRAIAEHLRAIGHAGHHRLCRIGDDLENRSAGEVILRRQAADRVLHRQMQLIDREVRRLVETDERAAVPDEG